MTERNPYLLLGLPFGASRDEANIAFARLARRLRRSGEEGEEQLMELTWALNQIDEAIDDPYAHLDIYRIPADPNAFDPPGRGLFTPPPERMQRRTPPSGEAARDAVDQATAELLTWVTAALAERTPIPEP